MQLVMGNTYKDKITGFEGVCTGIVTYITGCDQALLQPSLDDTGKPQKAVWYDDMRLEDSGAPTVVLFSEPAPKRRTGPGDPAPIK